MEKQQKVISYYPNLLGQTDRVIQQSVDNRIHLEQYIEFMSQRADIEEQYLRALQKLQDKIKNSGLTFLRDSLINQMHTKTELLINFVDLIRSEIIVQTKELLDKQNNISKRIVDEMKGLEWDLQDRQDDLMNARLDYKISGRELEQGQILQLMAVHSKETSEDKKLKGITKIEQLHKEHSKFEGEYQYLLLQYNEFIDVYNTKMENYLTILEQEEQERCLIQKDTLMKLFMFEISVIKKQLCDVEKLNEQIRKKNLQDSIEQFITKNQRPTEVPRPIDFLTYKSLVNHTVGDIQNGTYQNTRKIMTNNYDDFYSIYEELKKQKSEGLEQDEFNILLQSNKPQGLYTIFQHHINSIWNGKEIEISDQIGNLLKLNQLNRLLWCQALEITSNKLNYCIQSNQAYELIEKWFQFMIQYSLEQFQISSLRKLLTISSLLYIQTQNKRYYLANSFKEHKVFQAGDFIEAAIVQSIFDALNEDLPIQIIFDEKIKKQKINVLTQLSVTCFTLLLYNTKAAIKMYAETYLNHANILGDAQEHLMNQIEWYQG